MDSPQSVAFSLRDTGSSNTNSPEFVVGLETFKLLQNVRYSLAAVACIILYEWLINLPEEIRLIYPSRWSSVKIGYLLCRYYPLLYYPVVLWAYCGDYQPSFCKKVVRPVHALLAPFHFLGQCVCSLVLLSSLIHGGSSILSKLAVMFMRAYAFSGRNQKVLAVLCSAYIGLIGGDIYLFFVNVPVPHLGEFGLSLPQGGGCFPDYTTAIFGSRIGIAMIGAISLDLLSLGIVIIYCTKNHTGRTPLAGYFLKQGLITFAWISITNVISVIVYFKAHDPFSGLGLPFILVISNILACRLILSLRVHVRPTDTQLSREYSALVHAAFDTESLPQSNDIWVIHDSPAEDNQMA
ncbi:hypothetical protein HYPSUDRAFT_34644 [Hypholoma sublateritium FD-334 SS-4]|uniref:DUF6533 domain-containing protein n=1 Tax=Hypholoma sublateritium (strain FD-334 SS-4) TaxID=945553 RepID=A0A0D2LKK7_HYPSF|nr:hypothetical protein HYPSUDRAFT_34644 [Hypholoma sublateritium FD-334 SS-4]